MIYLLVLKIKIGEKRKEKGKKHRKYLHYFFLCLLFLLKQCIHSGITLGSIYFLNQSIHFAESNLFIVQDFIIISVEMAFMAILCKFFLKYKYYNHHIVSTIIFIVLGFACDIIIKNLALSKDIFSNKMYYVLNIIQLVHSFIDALNFCYQKYLMEVLYYPYWNIAFIPGLILFSLSIILLIICLADPKKEKSSVTIVKNFYLYSQNLNPWIIFGKVITVTVIHIILCPLTIL